MNHSALHYVKSLHEALQNIDPNESLGVIAAVVGKDPKDFKAMLDQKENISGLSASHLIDHMIFELKYTISLTPAIKDNTHGGEAIRNTLLDTMECLSALRTLLICYYSDSETWQEVCAATLEGEILGD